MFDGTNLTLISEVDPDSYMFGSHERSLTYRCIISSTNKSRYKVQVQNFIQKTFSGYTQVAYEKKEEQ